MKLADPRDLVKCRPYPSIRKEELSPASLPNPITFASNDGAMPNPTYLINYVSFHDQKPVRIKLGTAEEWTLKALPTDPNPDNPNRHPFHIHVNPFQIVAHTDATGKTTAMDVWKDTLLIPKKESYTIRSRFLDFPGKTVFHCHILDHEDQGMMMPLEFYDPDPSKPAPAQDLCPRAATPNVLKQTAVPAPALKLPDTIGGARDLTEFRRRTVALVFFQGAECAHCVQQLRALVRDIRGSIGHDAEIVAVSSRKLADPARAMKALGVTDSDRFHLLVDEPHRAFRDFGCFANGPQHGLFLIDGAGVIRSSYVGETPFGDTEQVIERIRQLASSGRQASR